MDNQETPNAPHVGPNPSYLISQQRLEWTPAEVAADVARRRGIQTTIMDVNAREEAKADGCPYLIDRASLNALWSGDKCPVRSTIYTFGHTNYLTNPVVVRAIPVLGFVPGNIYVCSLAVQMERYEFNNPDKRVDRWFKAIHDEATARFGPLSGAVAYPPKPPLR